MKAKRHQKILDIVRHKTVQTQEQLAAELAQEGIVVTQATISRDIKELRLVKAPMGEGTYRYSAPMDRNADDVNRRAQRMLSDVVISIEDSGNLIVIHTIQGAAQAVAAILDDLQWPEILGTVAGDDTIFIAVKPPSASDEVMARLNRYRK